MRGFKIAPKEWVRARPVPLLAGDKYSACIEGASNNFCANSSTLDRADCPERGNTAPPPSLRVFLPPRGIGDSPRIMHDKRGCDTHAYRGALAYFERRALPAEIPARGEEFGARKLKPVSTRLYGVARHSKSAPRLSSGGFAACESLAERRVIPSSKDCSAGVRTSRIRTVCLQARSEGVYFAALTFVLIPISQLGTGL